MNRQSTRAIKFLAGIFCAFFFTQAAQAQCGGAQAPPVKESFDNTTMPPGCWENVALTGTFDWNTGQQGDAGFGAGAASEHTGNGGYYAFVDFSDVDTAALISDTVDVSGMTNAPQVVYWYFSNNTDNPSENNTLELQAWDGSAWQPVATHAQNDPNWQQNKADLSPYIFGGSVRIRLVAMVNDGILAFYDDILVDDIQIRETPSCPKPTNVNATALSADSIEVSWTSNASGSEYQIHYDSTGFAPGTGDTVTTMQTMDTIVGLNASTKYDFYVREVCGAGDTSTWSGPISESTLCADKYSAVYMSGFDKTATNTPLCWSKIDLFSDIEIGGSGIHDDNLNPVNGSQNLVEFNDGNISDGDTTMLISPKLVGLSDGDKQLEFWVNLESGGSNEYFIIGTMTDPSNSSSFTSYDTIPGSEIPINAWERKTLRLNDTTAIPDSNEHIVIFRDGGAFELYMDEFTYEFIPDKNLAMDQITSPNGGFCLTSQDSVTVRVINEGTQPQSGFDVSYTIDAGTPNTETIAQTIQPFDTLMHTFAPTSAMSGAGSYQLEAYTSLAGDTLNGNDTASGKAIYKSGSLVPTWSGNVGVLDREEHRDTAFVCGANNKIHDCGRVLSLKIDSLRHRNSLDEVEELQLISPEGTKLLLWDKLGGGGDQVMDELFFTDTASQNVTAATSNGGVFSGAYRPEEAAGFSKFDGERLNGPWTLRVFNDDYTGGDTISFTGWSMRILDPAKPQPDLGADTTICKRENLRLDPGDNPQWSYVWGNNSTDSTRNIAGSFLSIGQSYDYSVTVTNEDPLNKCSNSDSISVSVESCSGIEEANGDALSFEVHPNPASERLNITSIGSDEQRFRYELFDLQGRKLETLSSGGNRRSIMNVSTLSDGVYILKGFQEDSEKSLFKRKVVVR